MFLVSDRYTGELTEIPLDTEDPPALTRLTTKGSYQFVPGLEEEYDERLTQDSYTHALKYGK